jgi:hypothetical protein
MSIEENEPAPKPEPEVSTIDKIIDTWHLDHFRGAPTTETWNLSVHAKEDLKQRLAKI